MKKLLIILLLPVIFGCNQEVKIEKRVMIEELINKGKRGSSIGKDIEPEDNTYSYIPNWHYERVSPLMYYEGKLFSGVGFDIDIDGELRYEANFKDGKLNGLFKRWQQYQTGGMFDYNLYVTENLDVEINYKDGKIDGLFKSYRTDGQIYHEGNYKDGELISERCWDESGNEKECL